MDNKQVTLFDGNIATLYESSIPKESIEKFQSYLASPEGKNMMEIKTQESIMESLKVDMPPIESPEERLKFLIDRIDSMQSELVTQTKELQSVHYENMKLNAQIEVLDKINDSNNSKLDELYTANAKLTTINQTLRESNNHYWRNTFIIAFVVALIFFLLGLAIPS